MIFAHGPWYLEFHHLLPAIPLAISWWALRQLRQSNVSEREPEVEPFDEDDPGIEVDCS